MDRSSVGTEGLPFAFLGHITRVTPIIMGAQKALAAERASSLSTQPLRWRRWMLVTECAPALAYRLYSFSLIVFPQVKLRGECCVVLGGIVPSCSYLHLLGSMPSSFGLDLGDGSFSVQREIEGGGALWCPPTVFGRNIKVARFQHSLIAS